MNRLQYEILSAPTPKGLSILVNEIMKEGWHIVGLPFTTRTGHRDQSDVETFYDNEFHQVIMKDNSLKAVKPDDIYLREEVLCFARDMEMRLKENEHKGGWQGNDSETDIYLLDMLEKNLNQLKDNIHEVPLDAERQADDIQVAAMDVANYAMMIWDRWSFKRAE